jgi:hypothetical protein
MWKQPEPLMVAVESVDGYSTGMRLFASDPLVISNRRSFVPFEMGDRAVFARREELIQEREAQQEELRVATRATKIKQSSARILGTDSAIAEAAKKRVQDSDGGYELAFDENGSVIGIQLSAKGLAARERELAARPRETVPAAPRQDGYVRD